MRGMKNSLRLNSTARDASTTSKPYQTSIWHLIPLWISVKTIKGKAERMLRKTAQMLAYWSLLLINKMISFKKKHFILLLLKARDPLMKGLSRKGSRFA
jgi:hypothetical protein